MFWRDKAIDPVAEAAKILAASKAHHAPSTTEFARTMIHDDPPSRPTSHAAAATRQKSMAAAPHVPTAPAQLDARVQQFKDALAKQGKTLTPEQLAALEKLGDAQKALLQKVGKGIGMLPQIIVAIVLLFVFFDFIPAIFAFVKSLFD